MPPDNTFSVDLVAALGELTNPTKDAKGQVRGNPDYRFTSLPALLDHVRPVLAAHGLVLSQPALSDVGAGTVGCRTILHHRSGETLDAGTLLLPCGPDAQAAGSALTYARRYAVAALLGIAPDDDDDGRAAVESPPRPPSGAREDAGRIGGYDDQDPNVPPPSPVDDAPTLPVGGGVASPDAWKAAAQRLTRAWKRNVTITDTKQAVVAELRRQDIGVKTQSEVSEDLLHHALRELERKGAVT